jgi:hypothetical protein
VVGMHPKQWILPVGGGVTVRGSAIVAVHETYFSSCALRTAELGSEPKCLGPLD